MSLGTTGHKCVVSDVGTTVCATKVDDTYGFTVSTRGNFSRGYNKVALNLDDLLKGNIGVTSYEQGSPKKASEVVVEPAEIIPANFVSPTGSLSRIGKEVLLTDVSFPLPPYICARFNPLLEEMLQKIVNLHSIIRRHSKSLSLSTSFDGKSSSSSFVESLSDIELCPRVDLLTIEAESEKNRRSIQSSRSWSVHKDESRNNTHYGSCGSSSLSVDSLSLEGKISPDDFLKRLRDDSYSPESAKFPEETSNLDKTAKREDNPPSETRSDAEIDVLALFCDKILDEEEEEKEGDVLNVARHHNHHEQQQQQERQSNVDGFQILLTPTNSTSSAFTTDDLLPSVDGAANAGHNRIGDHSCSKISELLAPSSTIRGNPIKNEDCMEFMQTCVDSLLLLRESMETRIRHVQEEMDAYYRQCCDCVARANLPKRQSELNAAVTKLCCQTDRLNTTQLLLRQEMSRLQVIRKAYEENVGHSTENTNSMYAQSLFDVTQTEEEELSGSASLPSSPVECYCRTASPLHSTNLLARDVLSHRRQLSRLVGIFCACPEAAEEWALILEQESAACYVALEKIFLDSQKEKEKLRREFGIGL